MFQFIKEEFFIETPTKARKTIPTGLKKLDCTLREDGAIAISYRTQQSSIADLLAQVKAAKISIADLRTEQPDLEDVFMALTYDRDG